MRLPIAFAVLVLAALALPGVRAARAEADLVPPAKQLFAYDAKTPPPRPAQPSASCGAVANQLDTARRVQAGREAALRKLAAVVAAEPGAKAEVLDGRGLGYPVRRDPAVELMRIQREAQRQRAGR
jgi:hypothetical protein